MVRERAKILEQRALGALTFLPGEEFGAEMLEQVGLRLDETSIAVSCTVAEVRNVVGYLERLDGDDAREALAQIPLDYEQIAADVRAWSRWQVEELGEDFSLESIATEQARAKKQAASRWARIDRRAWDAKSQGRKAVKLAFGMLDGVPARGELFDRLLETVLPAKERHWWSVSDETAAKLRARSENALKMFRQGWYEVVAEAIYARLWLVVADDEGFVPALKYKGSHGRGKVSTPVTGEPKVLPVVTQQERERLRVLVRQLIEQLHARLMFEQSKLAQKISERLMKRAEARRKSAALARQIQAQPSQFEQSAKQTEDDGLSL